MARVWGHFRSQAVGYVALFVALGGTAAAASGALPAGSVGTQQLKNGAVTGQKVAPHTLTRANINLSKLGTVPNSAHLGGLLPSAFQRSLTSGCPSGQAIVSLAQAGAPSCEPFGSGDGTITSVSAGTDLTGGGASGNVTINADETKLQRRLTGGCGSGQAIGAIAQDGTPSCRTLPGSPSVILVQATGLAGQTSSATATCPSGAWATGGGWNVNGFGDLTFSEPQPASNGAKPTGWAAGFQNQSPDPQSTVQITVFAVCMTP